jgi:hypothetical protein
LQHFHCDLLVVGGGGGALRAAIVAKEKYPRACVLVATKGVLGKSGVTGLPAPTRWLFMLPCPIPLRKEKRPGRGDGEKDDSPSRLTFRRCQRLAAGGAGLLWFEAAAVAPEGRANPRWTKARLVSAAPNDSNHAGRGPDRLCHTGQRSVPAHIREGRSRAKKQLDSS